MQWKPKTNNLHKTNKKSQGSLVSNKRVNYAIRHKRIPNTTLVEPDKRKEQIPANKTPDSTIENIKKHIDKFPRYRSHYTQKESQRHYLDPRLSISTMYAMYKEECEESGEPFASEWVYRNIFNTQFNLSFKPPQKDTCKTCDVLKIQIEACNNDDERANIQKQLKEHQQRASMIRESMNQAIKKSNRNTKVISFDLEKTLQLPFLRTNEVYYCRQLSLYNLGIHYYPEDVGIMHLWTEDEGKRGSEEVSSCLGAFFRDNVDEHVTKIIAYSDACGGQNRNFNVARFLMFTVNTFKNVEEIEINFMESGHSFLPNDTDFSHISDQIKRETVIYTVDGYVDVMKRSKKKTPFRVCKMKERFETFDELKAIIINRKKSEQHNKVNWMKIKKMVFKRNSLKMKYSWSAEKDADLQCVDFCRNRRAVEPTMQRLMAFKPKELYIGGLKVKGAKFDDIINKLLKYIPPVFQSFYTNLKSDNLNESVLPHPDYVAGSDSDSDSGEEE